MSPSPNPRAYFGHTAILPAAMLWWGRKGLDERVRNRKLELVPDSFDLLQKAGIGS
jgi:hypothetical protein